MQASFALKNQDASTPCLIKKHGFAYDDFKIKQAERGNLQWTLENKLNKLGVSRQAVSNWENNKNLPDLELIISMSRLFSVSLDDLILGGNTMNNLTEKLIKDGNETKRAKINLISISIGGILLCIGIACIFLKAVSVEYIDAQGILHENFFLIPIGFLCLLSGFFTLVAVGIKNIIHRLRKR